MLGPAIAGWLDAALGDVVGVSVAAGLVIALAGPAGVEVDVAA
jgi:hypothetical protein